MVQDAGPQGWGKYSRIQEGLGDTVNVFMYGSNLDNATLTNRLHGPDALDSMAGRIEPCSAKGWKVGFTLSILPPKEPAVASLEKIPTDGVQAGGDPLQKSGGSTGGYDLQVAGAAHGVVAKLTQAEYTKLWTSEGGGEYLTPYDEVVLDVVTYSGRTVRAVSLQVNPHCATPERRDVAPSARYLNLIQQGAREHKLHPDYLAKLDLISPATPLSAPAARVYSVAVQAFMVSHLVSRSRGCALSKPMWLYNRALLHPVYKMLQGQRTQWCGRVHPRTVLCSPMLKCINFLAPNPRRNLSKRFDPNDPLSPPRSPATRSNHDSEANFRNPCPTTNQGCLPRRRLP